MVLAVREGGKIFFGSWKYFFRMKVAEIAPGVAESGFDGLKKFFRKSVDRGLTLVLYFPVSGVKPQTNDEEEERNMKTIQIELTRRNVTPAEFLAYVRSQLKKKGIRDYASDLDLTYWAAGNDIEFDYHNDPNKPCKAERSISRPYEMQTYVAGWDGTLYNEICEMTFYDEKRGSGYYYLINRY